MQRFFSPATGGFYSSELHAEIPDDAVKITAKRHAELVAAIAAGATIELRKGKPVAVEHKHSSAELLELARRRVQREARRRILAIASLEQLALDAGDIAAAALELQALGAATIDFAPALERRRSIDAVRAAAAELELELEALGDAALRAFTPADSPRWP